MNANKNLTKSVLILIIGIIILGFTSLLAFGLSNQTSATGRSGAVLIGKEAPVFIAPLIDSSENNTFVSLNDYDGDILVLNFWASWCPPCRDETPGFQRLFEKYQDQGVTFLGINIQDGSSPVDAINYINEFSVTYPNIYDYDGNITVDYGVTGIPVTFFVFDNRILGRWVGSISEGKLNNIIQEILTNYNDVEFGENLEAFRSLN